LPSNVYLEIETRHLRAVIVLAEELSFTRAAQRLRISQPALSKLITELENHHHFQLFNRARKRVVEITDAGRLFVQEAHSALTHADRAVHFAQAAHKGCDTVLMVGHSPYANHAWTSALLAVHLPLFPKLQLRLSTMFAMELVRGVLAGEIDLALVTSPPKESQITATPFARTPLYVALLENHPAVQKDKLLLRDLANDNWILFAKRVHPMIHDALMATAHEEKLTPRQSHEIITIQQAVHLVSERAGVAILPKPMAVGVQGEGVIVKPLCDRSLYFETSLVTRADDNSRLTNEFARSFLRKFTARPPLPAQLELPLPKSDPRSA
jgi:DNA-binding transcriptional LysR family regulator